MKQTLELLWYAFFVVVVAGIVVSLVGCGDAVPTPRHPYADSKPKRELKTLKRNPQVMYCFRGQAFFNDKDNGALFVQVASCAEKKDTCEVFLDFTKATYQDHAQGLKFTECVKFEPEKAKPNKQ